MNRGVTLMVLCMGCASIGLTGRQSGPQALTRPDPDGGLGLRARRAGNSLREQSSSTGLRRAFLTYKQRHFAQAISRFRGDVDWGGVRDRLEAASADWPLDWFAAFSLELAAAAMDEGSPYWLALTELACDRFRAGTHPSDLELHWNLTWISLAERSGLEHPHPPPSNRRMVPTDILAHMEHVISRYPDASRLRLARIRLGAERPVHEWVTIQRIPLANPNPATRVSEVADAARRHLAGVADRFLDLENLAIVGPEAKLRAGYLMLFAGEADEALALFGDVAREARRDDIRYLAWLISARALAENQRLQDAIAAAKNAVSTLPSADSGRRLLAMLLFADDRQDEARVVADSLLGSASPAEDPWDWFPYGDASRWVPRLERLREMLR